MTSDLSSIQHDHTHIGPGDEPRLTLLRAVATARPLDEVASLVALLNQTGESPRPGDEALRMAAVSRPVDDVLQLVTLLKKPPHTIADADTALLAAAMGRPIEEVAALVAVFGPGQDNGPGEENVPGEENGPAEDNGPGEAEPPRTGTVVSGSETADVSAVSAVSTASAVVPRGSQASSWRAPAATAGSSEDVSPERSVSSGLRSPLRWPAAVALLTIGAVHLPTDIAGLRSGAPAAVASTAIAVLCLALAYLLAVRDTVWTWAGGAAAAVGTAAAHSIAVGSNSVHLLKDSLGNLFGGAAALAVACAVIAAVLAGAVLMRRQKPRTVADDS